MMSRERIGSKVWTYWSFLEKLSRGAGKVVTRLRQEGYGGLSIKVLFLCWTVSMEWVWGWGIPGITDWYRKSYFCLRYGTGYLETGRRRRETRGRSNRKKLTYFLTWYEKERCPGSVYNKEDGPYEKVVDRLKGR